MDETSRHYPGFCTFFHACLSCSWRFSSSLRTNNRMRYSSAFFLAPGSGLQRDPADITNDLLVAIYTQLSNSSEPPVAPNSFFKNTPEQGNRFRLQTILYPTLAISIIAALLAVSAKLWLLRYSRRVASSGTPYERAIRRQETYDGAVAWRLKEIIESIPLLMGIAVVMFALYIQ
jgi:hypothetical protein